MRTHRPIGANVGRIVPLGHNFVDAAGKIVIRKSITAFCAPKRFATGRGDEVLRYFDWAAGVGLNEVRPFSRVDWTGPPGSGVESGWQYDEAACERTIVEARARGLRCELVAHTGPYGTADDMSAHLRAVDALTMRYDSALLEVCNEPWQNGGYDLLSAILQIYRPQTPGWASGANPPPTSPPAGEAITYHSPRKDEWPRCFKDAYEFETGQGPNAPFAPGYPGPVMLDEPPRVEETLSADDWEAYAAGAAMFSCGATMHGLPDFQQCTIPTRADVLACVSAFVRGLNTPPVQRYSGYGRGDPPSSAPGSRRYWRWGDDGAQYEICVRPYSFRRL